MFETNPEREKRITVRVPESFHRAVKAKAAREGVSVSELLRSLLESWLHKPEPEP